MQDVVYMIIKKTIVSWDKSVDDLLFIRSRDIIQSSVFVAMIDDEDRANRIRKEATATGLVFSSWTDAAQTMLKMYPDQAARFVRQVQVQLDQEAEKPYR